MSFTWSCFFQVGSGGCRRLLVKFRHADIELHASRNKDVVGFLKVDKGPLTRTAAQRAAVHLTICSLQGILREDSGTHKQHFIRHLNDSCISYIMLVLQMRSTPQRVTKSMLYATSSSGMHSVRISKTHYPARSPNGNDVSFIKNTRHPCPRRAKSPPVQMRPGIQNRREGYPTLHHRHQ